MTNYHVRFLIDLNSMLIWFFLQIFSYYIRVQSFPNHKHFEVYYSYKKACRVSIWRPIYHLIVDTLLQLFMKKWEYSIITQWMSQKHFWNYINKMFMNKWKNSITINVVNILPKDSSLKYILKMFMK